MTVTVNLYSEEQEKALLEFLDNMHYDYQSGTDNMNISYSQKLEVLRPDNDFVNGKTTARDRSDIKQELKSVYR